MAISEKELESRIFDAGNKLLSPPSSINQILDSLDWVENLLAGVDQSPSESMKEAIVPLTKALVNVELLRHSDADVKVAVASCISEITRITAPEAPYEDDQMKEVFQLIVSSFEKLDDESSRSYTKRISILDTVAKVRSCVVMLDLECDDLIVEMFRHFFKTIRDHHYNNVFSSMETIMTLVVEESEDISVDLLSSMLDVLKKENKDVLPKARQLGEKVFVKCAGKLKPYLEPALSSSGASLDDYIKAVADVFQAGDEAVQPTDGDASNTNLAVDKNLINSSSEKAVEVAMETVEDAPPTDDVGPNAAGSKTIISNSILEKGNGNSSLANDNSEVEDHDTQDEKGEPSKTIAGSLNAEEPPKSKKKPKKSNRRRGRKSNSSKSSSKPLEREALNRETKVIDTSEHQVDPMDVDNIQNDDPEVDKEKSSDAPIPSPEASNNESADISSPSSSGSLADETRSKKDGQGKKKKNSIKEIETAPEFDSGKKPDTREDLKKTTGSKSKLNKHASKNSSSGSDQEASVPDSDDDVHELDDNAATNLSQETEVDRQPADKKKRGQAKATPAQGNRKAPAINERKKIVALPKSTPKATKDESDVEEVSRSSSKRKQRLGEEKAPKTKVYDLAFVGAKVKVWWPADKKYYQGVVDSFDAVKKKHKILYSDGDIEVLNLKEEKWLLVDGSKGHVNDGESPDELEFADETPKGKKTKICANSGSQQGKTGSAAKKSGASSSKSKATPKPESKKMNDSKTAGISKEEATKKVGKLYADKNRKSKASNSSNKLSDDDEDTPIGSIKSKHGTAKGASKSKGKSPKTDVKSSSSGIGKVEASTSTKDEESEDDSLESERTPAKSKEKSRSTSKSKSSKKRKRSLKG